MDRGGQFGGVVIKNFHNLIFSGSLMASARHSGSCFGVQKLIQTLRKLKINN